MLRVIVSGLRLYGYHGCSEAERQVGRQFQFDIEAELGHWGEEDEIGSTLDYGRLCDIASEANHEPAKLVETIANRIAVTVLAEDVRVQRVSVRVSKLDPPVPYLVGSAAAEIVLHRA